MTQLEFDRWLLAHDRQIGRIVGLAVAAAAALLWWCVR